LKASLRQRFEPALADILRCHVFHLGGRLKEKVIADILAIIKVTAGLNRTKCRWPSSKNQLMKTIEKQLMVLSLLALVVLTGCGKSPEAEQTKADAKAAAEKTADTAKDLVAQGKVIAQEGAQKATEIATNVAAKRVVIDTNVASHVKEATTNAVSEVKDKINNLISR